MAIIPNQNEIKKIVIGGKTYYFKDEAARAAIAAGIQLVSVAELPTASAETMGVIYLVPSSRTGIDKNVKAEYVTVKNGDAYVWEKIGDTELDLSDYTHYSHTHKVTAAGTNASSDVTFEAHTTDNALGEATTFTNSTSSVSGSATVVGGNTASDVTFEDNATNKAQVISGIPSATVEGYKLGEETKQKLSASAEGVDVNTVKKFVADSANGGGSVTNGSDAELAGGKVASFTQGAKASFTQGAKASWEAVVDEANEELSFSFTANGDDTFVANGDDTFVANELQTIKEGTGKATQVTLPTFAEQTVATSIKSQPSVTIALGATGDVDVVTAQGELTKNGTNNVTFGEASKVDVVKIGATGSAAAQTWAQTSGTISGTAEAQTITVGTNDKVSALTALGKATAEAQVFTGSEVTTSTANA